MTCDHVSTVFLHEGEKAAKFAASMTALQPKERFQDHPWLEDLSVDAVHLGWIGGAKAVHRSNWKALNAILARRGVEKVIVVLDNDEPGLAAITTIAKQLRLPTFAIRFPADWKKGFDIANTVPEDCFKCDDQGRRKYVGPSFDDCLSAATWATDIEVIPAEGRGRPTTVSHLRPSFARQWVYVGKTEQFVNRRTPSLAYKHDAFNRAVRAFSDTEKRVTDLLLQDVNVHCDGFRIKGDPKPFLDFVEHLLPIESERKAALRWIATLGALPEIRMKYSLLLVTEEQGIGKDTLATITRMLVGKYNTANPTAQHVIDSSFHDWILDKVLVIVSEIYEGHSWRAYNKLQGYITAETVHVNPEGIATYDTDCFAHFWMNSNSRSCLMIEDRDRRLLIPKVTEEKWPEEKFDQLYAWLYVGDGLGIILDWCFGYGDYVRVGEEAPKTAAKRKMIEANKSLVLADADNMVEELLATNLEIAISYKRIEGFLRPTMVQQAHYEKIAPKLILDRFRRKGLYVSSNRDRLLLDGRPDCVVLSKPAVIKLQELFKVILLDGEFVDWVEAERHTMGREMRTVASVSMADCIRAILNPPGWFEPVFVEP